MGELKRFVGGRVVVKTGDITEETVDVIVNAANGSLSISSSDCGAWTSSRVMSEILSASWNSSPTLSR